jgi:hypothetical protein
MSARSKMPAGPSMISAPEAAVFLDEDGVPLRDELGDAARHHRDAVLVVLDLCRNPDDHRFLLAATDRGPEFSRGTRARLRRPQHGL